MRLYIFYITHDEEMGLFSNLIHLNNNQLLSAYRNNQIQIIPLVTDDSLAKKIASEFQDLIIKKLPQDNITQEKLLQGNYEKIFFIGNPNNYLPKFLVNSPQISINVQKYNEFKYNLENPVSFFSQQDKKTGDDRKISEEEVFQAFETLSGLFPRETNWSDGILFIAAALYSYFATKPNFKFGNAYAGEVADRLGLDKEQKEKFSMTAAICVAIANGEINARTFKSAVEQIYQNVKGAISRRDVTLLLILLGVLGVSVIQAIPTIEYAKEADSMDPSEKVIQSGGAGILGWRSLGKLTDTIWEKTGGRDKVIIHVREELIPGLNGLLEKPLDWSRESLLINGKLFEESEEMENARIGVKILSAFLAGYYSLVYGKMGFKTFDWDTENEVLHALQFATNLFIAVVSGLVKESLLVANAWFPFIDRAFNAFATKIVNATEKPTWKTVFDVFNIVISFLIGLGSMGNAAEILVVNGFVNSHSLGYLSFCYGGAYAAAGPINTMDTINNHEDFVNEFVRIMQKVYNKYYSLEKYNRFIYGKDFEQFLQRELEFIARIPGPAILRNFTEKFDPKKAHEQIYLSDDNRYGNQILKRYKDASLLLALAKEQGMDLDEIYQRCFLKKHGMKKANVNDVEMGEHVRGEKQPLLSGLKL